MELVKGGPDRRIATCEECGETREMATRTLCFKCYRRSERQQKRESSPIDVNSPAVRKEHQKLLKAHASLLKTLGELRINEADLLTIRRVLDPYLLPIAKFVRMVDEDGTRERQASIVRDRLGVNVNDDLDVHCSPDDEE